MRRCRNIHTRLLKTTSEIKELKLKDELVRIERDLQESYRNRSVEEEVKAVKSIKRNSKYFFSYAKKFSKVNAKVGPLLNNDNEYVADSKEMVDLLQDQYQSVFNTPKDGMCEAKELFPDRQTGLTDVKFDNRDIIKAINELSITSAAGRCCNTTIYGMEKLLGL